MPRSGRTYVKRQLKIGAAAPRVRQRWIAHCPSGQTLGIDDPVAYAILRAILVPLWRELGDWLARSDAGDVPKGARRATHARAKAARYLYFAKFCALSETLIELAHANRVTTRGQLTASIRMK